MYEKLYMHNKSDKYQVKTKEKINVEVKYVGFPGAGRA